MKITVHTRLLISMVIIGIFCGISFYILMVPLESKSLIHCILMGVIFGFINYLTTYGIYKKYVVLKETNESLKQDLKLDKLTGLFNRRAFDNDILLISGNDVYSILFIDIDNFRNLIMNSDIKREILF